MERSSIICAMMRWTPTAGSTATLLRLLRSSRSGRTTSAGRSAATSEFRTFTTAGRRPFFFFSYEGLRLTSPIASQLYEVPSNSLRQAAPDALKPFLDAFPVSNAPDNGNGPCLLHRRLQCAGSLNASSIRIDHSFSDKFKIFGRYSECSVEQHFARAKRPRPGECDYPQREDGNSGSDEHVHAQLWTTSSGST